MELGLVQRSTLDYIIIQPYTLNRNNKVLEHLSLCILKLAERHRV